MAKTTEFIRYTYILIYQGMYGSGPQSYGLDTVAGVMPFSKWLARRSECFEVTYQLSRILEGLFGKGYDVGDCHKLSLCSLPLERGGRAHRSRG